ISLTIASSRHLEQTRRYASEQSALLAANRSVMSATQQSLREALAAISLQTMTLIGADCCEIESLLEGHHATELLAQVKVNDWVWEPSDYGRVLNLKDWPLTVEVVETRQAQFMHTDDDRLTAFEKENLGRYNAKALLVAPMQLNDRVTGVISFYSRTIDAFGPTDARLALDFGSLAALAIDRARTHQALSEQATRDGLTGILNRRALMHHLDHQMAVSERSNDVFSILIIDLNDFKTVNDTHGHIVGDMVLREIAQQIESSLRGSDLVGRYGGDEFLAILPNTDLVDAISLARRLYDTICSSTITLPNGMMVSPSFSVGAATYPLDASNREALIERADRAMYITKNAGVSPAELVRSGTGSLSLRTSAD
ncbi:MAG TPA: sensor domain-containing diguanylate cyclase, partial [Thermomicrobiales bacterium]|nr:sensor domain-containing diguanylate cyclase [Thermomicrobiales bacterium]